MKRIGGSDLVRFFFTADGRISRQEYVLGIAFVCVANAALIAFALHQENHDLALGLAIIVSAVPSTAALFVLAAKRCHDVGLSGALALAVLVPFIGLLWLVTLAFLAATPDVNAFGAPPRFDPD